MAAYPWNCPFCGHNATVREAVDIKRDYAQLEIDNSSGHCRLFITFIVCPNPKCKKYVLNAKLRKATLISTNNWSFGDELHSWDLVPASNAKVFPDYVPLVIVNDYVEACAIKNLSPKASATLARRCLQGMIRDYWGVSKSRLIDEIDAIKDKI